MLSNPRLLSPVVPLLLAAFCLHALCASLSAANLSNNGGTIVYGNTQSWANPSTFTNNAGSTTFTADTGSASSTPLSIIVNGGTVTLASTQHLNALTLNGGATSLTAGVTKTYALTIAGSSNNWTAGIDLTDQPLILEPAAGAKSTALATLQNEIAYGQSHAAGIFSSTLPADASIVLVDNAVFGQSTFRGINVDSNSLLVVPALLGDATLDGTVDLNDLNTVLNNLGTAQIGWTNGNFDGAATIDLNDLNDVLNHLGLSIGTASPALASPAMLKPAILVAPEPATLALAIPLMLLSPRRRQDRRKG